MRRHTLEEFIEKANQVHGGRYDYSFIDSYENNNTKVPIGCKEHSLFFQYPRKHLSGQGCPQCSGDSKGWSHTVWSSLKGDHKVYIIICSMDGEKFVKIGKTTKEISQRFKGTDLPYNYEKFFVVDRSSLSPRKLSELERKLHRELSDYRYEPKKQFGGSTECFTMECLWTDTVQQLVMKFGENE